MKIKDILNEDDTAQNRYKEQQRTQRSELADLVTPLQTGLLKRIASGKLDPFSDNLNDRIQGALDGLVDLDLLDATYDLTPTGEKFVRNTSKMVSPAMQDAQAKTQAIRSMKPVKNLEVPVDDDGDNAGLDPEDDMDGNEDELNSVSPDKPMRKKKGNALRYDDTLSFDNDDDGYQWD